MECSPYALADNLLANLLVHLDKTRAGAVSRAHVVSHTNYAVEFCPMAVVAVGSMKPVQVQRGGCGPFVWDLALTIGVHRCFPTHEHGAAPSPVEVDSAARDILDDGEAMRRAVGDAFDDDEYQVVEWRTLPPQGGSHGSTMQVTVRVSWGSFVEPRSGMLPGDPRG